MTSPDYVYSALLPTYIKEQYAKGVTEGGNSAVALAMDITGFTSMTQSLMNHGKIGAEILSNLLNKIFTVVVDTVYEHQGFITGFAGDSFTALFEFNTDLERQNAINSAHIVAESIRSLVIIEGLQQTIFGDFQLHIKIGLALGTFQWKIIGPDEHKIYFFRGQAIEKCLECMSRSKNNEIIVDDLLKAEFLAINVPSDQLKPKYHQHYGDDNSLNNNQLDNLTIEKFFPKQLLDSIGHGEFRNVVNIFISFQENKKPTIVDDFISKIIQLTDQFGGYFSKLDFGDKGGIIMVQFGAPIERENNLERALGLLLALRNETISLNNPIKWRAGLTNGLVYAGLLGSKKRAEYTVLGTAVNLAARLALKGKWGQILLVNGARHRGFRYDYLGNLRYKGFSKAIPTYQLLQAKAFVEKFFDQTMVGRDNERDLLLLAAQPLFSERFAGLAVIYGEAGIGKSRLAYALRESLNSKISWFTGQTDQILRQSFNPFIYFLNRYFHQSAELSIEENKKRFEEKLQWLISKLDKLKENSLIDELNRTKSALGAFLDLHWENSLYETLDAQRKFENNIIAIKTLLLAESRLKPVVFELEDAHWLDEASHELINRLTYGVNGYPIFIVITARHNADGSKLNFRLSAEATLVEVDLDVLSVTSLKLLAENILDDKIDDSLLKLLQEKTQANPFFAQQLLYYFRENDFLEKKSGHLQLKTEVFEIPSGINAILVARIDRLAGHVKEIVKAAAVLGREFEINLLSHMLKAEIFPEVKAAEREHIWGALSELRYIFKHALLQEAAYQMQLSSRLKELHRAAAVAYESSYQTDLNPYYADLAYHYGQAQDREKEKFYCRLAGQRAASLFANKEAIRFFSRALELSSDPHERFDLLLSREQIEDLLGLRQEQAADLQTLTELAEKIAPLTLASVHLRWAHYGIVTSSYALAIANAQRAIELAQHNDPEHLGDKIVAAGYSEIGTAFLFQGLYNSAQEELEKVLLLAHNTQAPEIEAEALRNSGMVALLQGNFPVAHQRHVQALRLVQQLNVWWAQAACLNNLGEIERDQNNFDGALEYYRQALAIFSKIGDQRGESIVYDNIGIIADQKGDYVKARFYQEKALQLCEPIQAIQTACYAWFYLGLADLHENDPQAAQKHCLEAVKLTQQHGMRHQEAFALTVLARALSAVGKLAEAKDLHHRALQIRHDLHQPNLATESLAGLAEVAWLNKQNAEAQSYVEQILQHLEHGSLYGTDEPLNILLVCYHVLLTNRDQRAETILLRAHNILQDQVNKLQNKEEINNFILNVATRREIARIWQQNYH